MLEIKQDINKPSSYIFFLTKILGYQIFKLNSTHNKVGSEMKNAKLVITGFRIFFEYLHSQIYTLP